MAHADFRGTTTYFAVFKMMISSKNVNQNILKIPYFSAKFVKICQALEVPPPDPSWPLVTGGSAPRPLTPCNLIHTYCSATKRFKFVVVFNDDFKARVHCFSTWVVIIKRFLLNPEKKFRADPCSRF